MTHYEFLEIQREKVPLFHHAVATDFEIVEKLSTLPYFKNLVNDDTNEDGWSPLIWSISQEQEDLRIVELLHENGLDLLQRKRDDGLNALHIASFCNDI